MFQKFCLFLIAASGGIAQVEDESIHRLRLLAVGSPPPFVQEVRDGVRYEIPAEEGTIPPRVVMLPAPAESGAAGTGQKTPVRLRLGQTTGPLLLIPPESGRVRVDSKNGGKWLDLPLHPCGASLALVWRGGRDWNEPRAIVVADDAEARAEGKVHLSNLTASPMAVVIGTEKIRLDPGKTFTRRMNREDGAMALDISYASSSGNLRRCHSSTLELTRGCFHRIIIYAADGQNPRMPVKVLQLEEAG